MTLACVSVAEEEEKKRGKKKADASGIEPGPRKVELDVLTTRLASTQAPFTRAQGGVGCGKRAWYPLSAHASKFHGIP